MSRHITETIILFVVVVSTSLLCAADENPVELLTPSDAPAAAAAPAPEKPKASAEEVKAIFDQLFSSEIKLVKATADASDDVVLAKRLMEATASIKDEQRLVALLCENAYELASKDPAGYDTAIEALAALSGIYPEKSADYSEKTLSLRQRQYNAARGDDRKKYGQLYIDDLARIGDRKAEEGDVTDAILKFRVAVRTASLINSDSKADLASRITELTNLQLLYRRVDMLKDKIKRDPKDKDAAQQLLMLYVVDLDKPAEARKFTFLIDDKALNDNIRYASAEGENIPADAALNLGEWYRALAAEAKSPTARATMFSHAAENYQRYLDSGTGDALTQTKAKLGLSLTEEALEKLNERLAEQSGDGGGVDTGSSPNGTKMVFDPGYYMDEMVIYLQKSGRVSSAKGDTIGRWSQKRNVFTLSLSSTALHYTYASERPKVPTVKNFYFDFRRGIFTGESSAMSLQKASE
ncbi:MAG: hypothetical protein GC159_04260 [Phycisphaera sp.]|nr:hypothetical protein [Phycisphaera sp.]